MAECSYCGHTHEVVFNLLVPIETGKNHICHVCLVMNAPPEDDPYNLGEEE